VGLVFVGGDINGNDDVVAPNGPLRTPPAPFKVEALDPDSGGTAPITAPRIELVLAAPCPSPATACTESAPRTFGSRITLGSPHGSGPAPAAVEFAVG
jgi:hypothetical protein